jgi:hypothetical protein
MPTIPAGSTGGVGALRMDCPCDATKRTGRRRGLEYARCCPSTGARVSLPWRRKCYCRVSRGWTGQLPLLTLARGIWQAPSSSSSLRDADSGGDSSAGPSEPSGIAAGRWHQGAVTAVPSSMGELSRIAAARLGLAGGGSDEAAALHFRGASSGLLIRDTASIADDEILLVYPVSADGSPLLPRGGGAGSGLFSASLSNLSQLRSSSHHSHHNQRHWPPPGLGLSAVPAPATAVSMLARSPAYSGTSPMGGGDGDDAPLPPEPNSLPWGLGAGAWTLEASARAGGGVTREAEEVSGFPSWDRSILTAIYLCHAVLITKLRMENGPDRRSRRGAGRAGRGRWRVGGGSILLPPRVRPPPRPWAWVKQ